MMDKLFIAFGSVILLVVLPRTGQSQIIFRDSSEVAETNMKKNYVAKGEFVKTDGKKKECESHTSCYDQREPQTWCKLTDKQSFLDKGCFCDEKLHSCVFERMNSGKREYAYCASVEGWQCLDSPIINDSDISVHIDTFDDSNITDDIIDNGNDDYVAKGEFVETDGKEKKCNSDVACYDQREPLAWCERTDNQSWIDKGCFCDEKLHSCVIEQMNNGRREYTYCAPAEGWQCSDSAVYDAETDDNDSSSIADIHFVDNTDFVVKGKFVETDGKEKKCNSHDDCYDQIHPRAWCKLTAEQSFIDKGCFCEDNLHSCVIERMNSGNREYSYCAALDGWKCY